MDDRRFDDLTRSLAGFSRRRLLAGLTGALLGGAAQLDARGANAACRSRQVYRRGIGCICVGTGRPPSNQAGTCPCPSGLTDCGGSCVDVSSHRAHCGACDAPCRRPDRCSTATCAAGVCTIAAISLDCPASGQCHDPGACDPSTGACTDPIKADGSPCDDGDACTQIDTCRAGACVGGDPVVCAASDQCHAVGTCHPVTGACSNPARPDGTACIADSDACTADSCQTGVCVTGAPKDCATDPAVSDQCNVGVCNTTTGLCQKQPRQNGTSCDDGDACTVNDTCQNGVCAAGIAVVCSPLDQCHVAGACDPQTGQCSDPPKPDGAACDDGDPCTGGDSCQAGRCVGGAPAPCCTPGTCQAGQCGTIPDGCGSALSCDCPSGQTCGGGGKPNVCGCTPTCAGKCPGASDGCGGVCSGSCEFGQDCCGGVCRTGNWIECVGVCVACPGDRRSCRGLCIPNDGSPFCFC